MKISELQPRQGKIEMVADVEEVGEVRTFNKFGKEGKVANATIRDESGKMTLTLWNEQADQVKQGDRIAIHNGYVGEWQGELQLSTGKFGTLEVLSKQAQPTTEPTAPSPKAGKNTVVEEERLG